MAISEIHNHKHKVLYWFHQPGVHPVPKQIPLEISTMILKPYKIKSKPDQFARPCKLQHQLTRPCQLPPNL